MPEIVLLIHGTFADDEVNTGDKWWQRCSDFWKTLTKCLGPDFDVQPHEFLFHWSGKNYESYRAADSVALRDRLLELEAEGVGYHLIGHSHGGSVIWGALLAAQKGGDSLRNLRSWTTVGTPFLQTNPEPVNFWAAVLAAVGWAALYYQVPAILTYFSHFRDYVVDQGYVGAGILPIVWLLLAVLAISATTRLVVSVVTKLQWLRRRHLARVVFLRFADKWLGIWCEEDEVISGLKSATQIHGDLVPRLRSSKIGFSGFLLAPFRWIYNELIATVADDFVWFILRRKSFGDDISGHVTVGVSNAPIPGRFGWPKLPDSIVNEIVARADTNAVAAVANMRKLLGWAAGAGPDAPTLLSQAREHLTGSELVHTTYFDSPAVVELLEDHIRSHAHGSPHSESSLKDQSSLENWLHAGRSHIAQQIDVSELGLNDVRLTRSIRSAGTTKGAYFRASRLAEGGAALFLLLAAVGFSSDLDSYTNAYQVQLAIEHVPLEQAYHFNLFDLDDVVLTDADPQVETYRLEGPSPPDYDVAWLAGLVAVDEIAKAQDLIENFSDEDGRPDLSRQKHGYERLYVELSRRGLYDVAKRFSELMVQLERESYGQQLDDRDISNYYRWPMLSLLDSSHIDAAGFTIELMPDKHVRAESTLELISHLVRNGDAEAALESYKKKEELFADHRDFRQQAIEQIASGYLDNGRLEFALQLLAPYLESLTDLSRLIPALLREYGKAGREEEENQLAKYAISIAQGRDVAQSKSAGYPISSQLHYLRYLTVEFARLGMGEYAARTASMISELTTDRTESIIEESIIEAALLLTNSASPDVAIRLIQDNLKNSALRQAALYTVIRELGRAGHSIALEEVKGLPEYRGKKQVLVRDLALFFAEKGMPKEALEAVELSLSLKDRYELYNLLWSVAKILSIQLDPTKVIQFRTLISSADGRAVFLLSLARELVWLGRLRDAYQSLTLALAEAEAVPISADKQAQLQHSFFYENRLPRDQLDPNSFGYYYDRHRRQEAATSVDATLEFARTVDHSAIGDWYAAKMLRQEAMARAASGLAQGGRFDEALALIKDIPLAHGGSNGLAALVEAAHELGNFSLAQIIASKMISFDPFEGESSEPLMRLGLARYAYKPVLFGWVQSDWTGRNSDKDRHLKAVAESLARHPDVDGARSNRLHEVLMGITDDGRRNEAIKVVALQLSLQGDFQEAAEITPTIKNKTTRALVYLWLSRLSTYYNKSDIVDNILTRKNLEPSYGIALGLETMSSAPRKSLKITDVEGSEMPIVKWEIQEPTPRPFDELLRSPYDGSLWDALRRLKAGRRGQAHDLHKENTDWLEKSEALANGVFDVDVQSSLLSEVASEYIYHGRYRNGRLACETCLPRQKVETYSELLTAAGAGRERATDLPGWGNPL